jgi:tetratricopeptide (TPR) repeat protein
MEQLFKDRLSEFYETLAFHFQRGQSLDKAVEYLIKSGEKSLRRYALEESHQYYKEAFNLLSQKQNRSQKEDTLLVDLLIEWALVFYYQGNFTSLTGLMSLHEDMVNSLGDKARAGLFYSWLGFSLFWQGERMKDSYQYLLKALELGEEVQNQKVVGYACAFLSKTCAELGLLEEGVKYVNRAKDIVSLFADDAVIYMNYLSGKGYLGWFAGEKMKVFESGKDLLDSGQKRSNIRLQAVGYLIMGMYRYLENDLPSAIECTETVHNISRDPYHSQYANVLLGMYYAYSGDFESAENALAKVVEFSKQLSVEYLGTFAHLFLGVVSIAKGNMGQGMKQIEHAQHTFRKNERIVLYALSELILGSVYLRILQKSAPSSLSLLKKNIWFLIRNVPLASRKAEGHFNKVIEIATNIGAKGFLGQAYLDLGLLHNLKGRNDQAKACMTVAIRCLRQCNFEMPLKHAEEALASLDAEK